MKAKPIALLTAGVMLTAPVTLMPAHAAEQLAAVQSMEKLPEWIPTDFESALEFRNTYGATHIEDGLICAVFWEQAEKVAEDEPRGVLRYGIIETEDMTQCLKRDIYASKDKAFNYEVRVYKPIKQGEFEISFTDTWVNTNGEKNYTFSIDGLMNAVETDIYSWLPDCEPEYKDYVEKYGLVSVRNNFVVFCMDSSAGIPFTWQEKSDSYSDKFKLKASLFCNNETAELVDGGEMHRVAAYQAVKDGYAKIEWEYIPGQTWELASPFSEDDLKGPLTADCVILDAAHTVLLSDQTRVTVTDKDTGELMLDKYLESHPFKFHADIIYKAEQFSSLSGDANYTVTKNKSILQECYLCPSLSSLASAYKKADHFKITTEDQPEIMYYDNGAMDMVFRLKKESGRVLPEEKSADLTDLKKGETRITVYDKDTGELIPSELLENHYCGFGTDIRFEEPNVPGGWMMTGPIYVVKSNPQVYQTDLAKLYRSADYFEFLCDDQPEVTLYDNGAMDLVIRTKIKVSGNINGDVEFNIADMVALQKWLLNAYDKEIYRWGEADFDLDNELTVFDLILMRKELIKKNAVTYVEPDKRLTNASPLRVLVDGLKLYLGPDEGYQIIDSIPEGTRLYEIGYQNDNSEWLFTEYKGKYGWVKTVEGDNETMTLYFEKYVDKPVIYLYPEEETEVYIELELTESELSTTYPRYNNGWDVVASPDGSLLNKADGTHHKYLFWDSANCRTRFDMSNGFCVAGSDTESFLKEKLTYMGLTEEEMNEFIVYWLPRMEHNKYNLIAFQGDVYTNSAKLNITPTPDSLLRVFMTYVPLDNAVDIEPQQLDSFERKGFTVVEWGGCEI